MAETIIDRDPLCVKRDASTTSGGCPAAEILLTGSAIWTRIESNRSVPRNSLRRAGFFCEPHVTVKNEIKTILILVLSGLLLTAAFPKMSQDRLAWLALVPLLWAVNDAGPREAFRRGLVFGIAHFLSLLYWLVPTMVIYGHLPGILSVSILFIFAAVLSLFFIAPMTWGFALVGRTPLRVLLFFPVFWVGFEYLRSFLFTGFPWELLGYSQHSRLQLIQISDIVGVYGVSGLIALANAALFLATLVVCRKTWRGRPVTGRMAIGGIAATAVLVGLTWSYGELRIRAIDRLASAAPTVRVAVVQGNIEQSQKWEPAFQAATIENYIRLSLSTRPQQPELIVWPESAAPFYFIKEVPPTRMLLEGVVANGTYFLIGAPAFESKGRAVDYFNRAYLIGPGGEVLGTYDKAHLVPLRRVHPVQGVSAVFGENRRARGRLCRRRKGHDPGLAGSQAGHPDLLRDHLPGTVAAVDEKRRRPAGQHHQRCLVRNDRRALPALFAWWCCGRWRTDGRSPGRPTPGSAGSSTRWGVCSIRRP